MISAVAIGTDENISNDDVLMWNSFAFHWILGIFIAFERWKPFAHKNENSCYSSTEPIMLGNEITIANTKWQQTPIDWIKSSSVEKQTGEFNCYVSCPFGCAVLMYNKKKIEVCIRKTMKRIKWNVDLGCAVSCWPQSTHEW